MLFNSRRSEYAAGYLEFIWIQNPEVSNPQAIAIVQDTISRPGLHQGERYTGVFGTQVVYGKNVAEVKAELFPLIEAYYA